MRDLTVVPAEAGPVPARALDYIRVDAPQPVVLAYGIGVDSTALLLELESRGTPPDLVITGDPGVEKPETRSEEHTSELQSLMRISYAVFCLKKKKNKKRTTSTA